MTMAIVHKAGPVIQNQQRCVTCEHLLIDYKGVAVMVQDGDDRGLAFWAEGASVGIHGHGSYVLADRPLDNDERLCSERIN